MSATKKPVMPPPGHTLRHVLSVIGSVYRVAVSHCDNHEMDYNVHWWWNGRESVYTAAGMRVIADYLESNKADAAALQCRELANQLDAEAAPDAQPEPTLPKPSDASAHEEEVRLKRWDLREDNT